MTIEEAEKLLRAVPLDELGGLNYGEGTCTSWDEHREEHEEADEDEKPNMTYMMVCEGAERVRQHLIAALRSAM